jgi:hypothetical protein
LLLGYEIPLCVPARLDLGHGGSTFPNSGSAHVDTRSAAVEGAEDGGNEEREEGEVEEGSCSLSFLATTLSIASTISDVVGAGVALNLLAESGRRRCVTYAVAAGVNTKTSSQSCSTSEEEEGVQEIEDERNDRVTSEAVTPCCWNKVEQRQEGEHRCEHVVVDSRWVASERLRDDGADEGQGDKDEEELQSSQDEVEGA